MTFPVLPPNADSVKTADVVNRINRGKFNATIDVTLSTSTSTTVTDSRLSATSVILLDPLTDHAVLDYFAGHIHILGTDRTNGSCIISHNSHAHGEDRTFRLLIIG